MTVSFEEQQRKAVEPKKREVEQLVEQLLRRNSNLTKRQRFFMKEALDNARCGRFSLAKQDIADFLRPESDWSHLSPVTDEMVEGVNHQLLLHRLDELKAMPPQWPPVFTDFAAWSTQQAALLRLLAVGERLDNDEEVDWGNVIEEIESSGRSQQNELASRVRTVLEHLLRHDASPANDPRAGWRSTIERGRADIEKLLEDNPSLRPRLDDIIAAELPRARKIAATTLEEYGEHPRTPLDQLSYTKEQVLGSA
jgi:hypothetical protein